MATKEQPVRYEDVAGVKSRVAWGAVLGGSVVTLSLYVIFTLLLAAIGLSITEAGGRGSYASIGTVIAGVFCMGLALFLGGVVTSQMTAGETKHEAMIYGILTWATVTTFSLLTVGMGVKAGYHGLLGAAYVAQSATKLTDADVNKDNWQETARQYGVSEETISKIDNNYKPEDVRAAINDPENQSRIRVAGMTATWTALVGTLLAMSSAIGGAIVGSGPEFRLIGIRPSLRQPATAAR